MNDKIGNISFYDPQNDNGFQKPYSEETGKIIDQEVKNLSDQAYQRALSLLTEKRREVEIIAEELLKKEVLYKDDLERLIGKRPFEEHSFVDVTSASETPANVPPADTTEDTPKEN